MDDISQVATLTVIDGFVEFYNELGSILAGTMTSSRVQPGEPPTKPKKISKKAVPKWQKNIEPSWGFNLKPEKTGKQPSNEPLRVKIQMLDTKNNSFASKYSGEITISTVNKWMSVSNDGSGWNKTIPVNITNGKGAFLARTKTKGSYKIITSAKDSESKQLILEFYQPQIQKKAMQKKIDRIVEKTGHQELKLNIKNRTLQSTKIVAGIEDLNTIIQNIENGKYEIIEFVDIKKSDGTMALKLIVKPRKQVLID